MSAMYFLQILAGLIVLAEALNKIERSDLFAGLQGCRARLRGAAFLLCPWAWRRPRIVTVLKTLGWCLLAWGAFKSMLAPPTGGHVAVIVGFALLIVRSRIKEG